MNTDPFRLRVLTALQASLRTLTPENGSSVDLANAVYVGRDLFGDNDPTPLVCILESIDEDPAIPSAQTNEARVGGWKLLIQGFTDSAEGDQPLAPAYHLAAEVERQLAAERSRGGRTYNILGMGGLVEALDFSKAVVRPADGDVSNKAYFWLRLTLKIVENPLDPYE